MSLDVLCCMVKPFHFLYFELKGTSLYSSFALQFNTYTRGIHTASPWTLKASNDYKL